MTHKTMHDWQAILDAQKSSGLSIKAFCQQHNITNSNFYKHRKKLNVTPLNTSLIKVTTANRPISNATTTNNRITLLHGKTTLIFTEQCEPLWLADLLKALQS